MIKGLVKPNLKDFLPYFIFTTSFCIISYFINEYFDTNFMFLMYAHPGTPLVWFAENWGSHFLGFPVLISAIAVAMYTGVFVYRKLTN